MATKDLNKFIDEVLNKLKKDGYDVNLFVEGLFDGMHKNEQNLEALLLSLLSKYYDKDANIPNQNKNELAEQKQNDSDEHKQLVSPPHSNIAPVINQNSPEKYDLIVIGGGSAGIASAKRAASYGAKVKLFEYKKFGGTCVNVGCVPKKLMWTASSIATTLDHYSKHYGFTFGNNWKHNNHASDFDMKGLKQRRDNYVTFLNGIYQRNLDKLNISHERSYAKFVDSNVIRAGNKVYTAPHILIAVGGFPYIPNIPGKDCINTSDDFFNKLDYIPAKTAIVGAGYIAVELAQVLQGLGSKVSLFIRGAHPLRKFDVIIQNGVHNALVHSGVNVVIETNIDEIRNQNDGKCSMVTRKGTVFEDFDYVMYAIGRGPLAKDLGLDKTGVKQDRRHFIISNEFEETEQKGIHAIGDINNKAALTPVAIRAGRKWADRLFGGKGDESKMDYTNIPTVIFTHPPVGTCGFSEREVREMVSNGKFEGPINVYESHFRNLMYGVMSEEVKIRTHMKLICVGKNEKVVGLHIIGEGADEMLQGFGVAMKMGATKSDFDSVVAIHPTAAEELVTLKVPRGDDDFVYQYQKSKI